MDGIWEASSVVSGLIYILFNFVNMMRPQLSHFIKGRIVAISIFSALDQVVQFVILILKKLPLL